MGRRRSRALIMLALYRKYRPKTLSEVIGQPQITEPLENALKSGKVSHSYLFTGPRGCGKTSVARILAHEINNFKYELEDSYLDIIEIDAASNTGVDNIRDLREKAMIAPSDGKYKVYIIDEVHMLSKSAFNALLKTLEEPPEHVVFILATTDLEKVPVTITSRSQVFTFRLADSETMLPHLKSICEKEGIKISDSALKIVISRGGGSFRDSLSLLDQISSLGAKNEEISEELVASVLGLPLDSKLSELLSAFESQDFSAISSNLKNLLNEGLKPESIAESLLKKIISSPAPAFLPLLESLPKVSAPFPEAKLLLALLSFFPKRNNDTNEKSKTSLEATEENSRVSQGGHEGEQSMAGVARSALRAERLDDERNTPEFSLAKEKVLNFSAASISPAIAQQLKKCKLEERDGVTHIFPTRKIVKTILERPGNRDILAGIFNNGFVIHDLDDLEKSPEIAQISDIMGNIEEVNNDGGVPF